MKKMRILIVINNFSENCHIPHRYNAGKIWL